MISPQAHSKLVDGLGTLLACTLSGHRFEAFVQGLAKRVEKGSKLEKKEKKKKDKKIEVVESLHEYGDDKNAENDDEFEWDPFQDDDDHIGEYSRSASGR